MEQNRGSKYRPLHKYSQLIFAKGVKPIQQIKVSLFNKQCWYDWISDTKFLKMNLDKHFTLFTNI